MPQLPKLSWSAAIGAVAAGTPARGAGRSVGHLAGDYVDVR
ncbi:hypothetical protein ACQEV4_04410 [Streptomyces shenzhenensis]